MSEQTRALVAVVCLIFLAYGIVRYTLAERHADEISRQIPRARAVFEPLVLGKRFTVTIGICLFLIVQPWLDVGPEGRGVLFIAGSISFALSARFIDTGYTRWVGDISHWIRKE